MKGKNIPLEFECFATSELQPISQPTEGEAIGRLRVGVFSKGWNDNGSYITDEIANKLIADANKGNIPVVGFYDRTHQDWDGHVGPNLAGGFGYIEKFIGWQPMVERRTGVTKDYAVFSVVMFVEYFDEAKQVLGKGQSMELDEKSIAGRFEEREGRYGYIYSNAKLSCLTILGKGHEPCYSASYFFEKYKNFSTVLNDLKEQVISLEKGRTEQMEENMVQGTITNNTTSEIGQTSLLAGISVENNTLGNWAYTTTATETEAVIPASVEMEVLMDAHEEMSPEEPAVAPEEPSREELLAEIARLREVIDELNDELEDAREKIGVYEAAEVARENERKKCMIDGYASRLTDEEVEFLRKRAGECDYETLEKEALAYIGRHAMDSQETVATNFSTVSSRAPLLDQEENAFAALMAKYKK